MTYPQYHRTGCIKPFLTLLFITRLTLDPDGAPFRQAFASAQGPPLQRPQRGQWVSERLVLYGRAVPPHELHKPHEHRHLEGSLAGFRCPPRWRLPAHVKYSPFRPPHPFAPNHVFTSADMRFPGGTPITDDSSSHPFQAPFLGTATWLFICNTRRLRSYT